MNARYALVITLVTALLIYVQCVQFAVLPIAENTPEPVTKAADPNKTWVIEVHNEGKHNAQLYCGFENDKIVGDDKIGGDNGLQLKPGEKLAWGFAASIKAWFWCVLDWNGRRLGWDVYVGEWIDVPNPTKWSIKDDGIYDQWLKGKWRHFEG